MTTVLIVVHVLVSLFLIFIVLIQGGKGAELGAAFGSGSSQTLFGGRGAATFLGKITTAVAAVFMVTSLLLALASVRSQSVVKKTIPPAERPAAAGAPVPGMPGQAQPGGEAPGLPPVEQAPAPVRQAPPSN